MDRSLLVATSNPGKLAEVCELLSDFSSNIISLNDLKDLSYVEPPEIGSTYSENALIKARYYGDVSMLPSLADDSGLSIDVLNGEPGVQSARWHKGTDLDRNVALLKRMKEETNRSATFTCAIALYNPVLGAEQIFEGEVHGIIAKEPMGEMGFGYDPIFIPDGMSSTFAQLGQIVKNTISHRTRALKKVHQYILNNPHILNL